ncbi:MAG: isoprenylcysteine carboxylmethyltransferase family protein [Bryobacterales bacterium]|nr:isoprenylcysteine carboxylmethyltransferase family protein [Bryobacterales bacterium]
MNPYSIVYTIGAALLLVGGFHRLQAARSREPLNRRHEGWLLLVGIRLCGLAAAVSLYYGFRDPSPISPSLQWAGTVTFAGSAAWLAWMFISLGRNLTDTVVTRRAAVFVSHGPYKYVRNPMYIGVLAAGLSLAVVLGSWLVALFTVACFVQLAIRTRIEERFLLARFGETYKTYMSEVGRFLPYIL